MVVVSHITPYHADLLGPAGVAIFFVLSGFLITSLLSAEQDRFGRVSLKDFYARRALRLLPALLLLVALTPLVLRVTDDPRADSILPWLLTSLFYVQDFFTATGHNSSLAHTWSLAVEEQFYIVWPLLLGLIAVRSGHDPARTARAVRTLWCLALGWHLVSIAALSYDWMHYSPDSNAVFLLTGCWLATAVRARTQAPQIPTAVAIGALALLCLAPLVLTRIAETHWRAAALAMLVVTLTSVLPVLRAAGLSVLAHPVLRWFGTVSYGLYLWNWVLISLEPHGRELTGKERLLAALLALGVCTLSWYCFERPILRLKSRFQRVSSMTAPQRVAPTGAAQAYPIAAQTAPIPITTLRAQQGNLFAPTLHRGATSSAASDEFNDLLSP